VGFGEAEFLIREFQEFVGVGGIEEREIFLDAGAFPSIPACFQVEEEGFDPGVRSGAAGRGSGFKERTYGDGRAIWG
jgi:hypothetical protein